MDKNIEEKRASTVEITPTKLIFESMEVSNQNTGNNSVQEETKSDVGSK